MDQFAYLPQNATEFEFVSSVYKDGSSDIVFSYRVSFKDAEPIDFVETITVSDNTWTQKLPESFVKAVVEDLHLVLGISYYKLFCPPQFKTNIELSLTAAHFWNTVYKKGLGEFLYRNKLSLDKVATFPVHEHTKREITTLATSTQSLLVGIGGGKDSIVSLELLKDYPRTGFVVETGKENSISDKVAQVAQVPLVKVKRTLDPKLISGVEGSYGGHVPISAVYAFLGILEAALLQHGYVVVSNEYSSNFGNLMHEGNEVNHQWSKSSEFEKLFQEYVRSHLTPSIVYFSLLRPFYELRLVKMFTQMGKKYFSSFSSCNRNFAHSHALGSSLWCGECPKCAFAFLMLSAFLPKEELLNIFKKDLFEDRSLLPLFTDILGCGTLKPFDCVGTFDESKVALKMASENYKEAFIVQELLPLLSESSISKTIFSAYQALTIPSRFRLLGMESALILGYGREGHANEMYLKSCCAHMKVGIADVQDGEGYLDEQKKYDIVIKTPVIPSRYVTQQYVTGTQLFFSKVHRAQVIGVTGSKGKSTTATLLYLMLKKAGKKVRLVGNIGVPALLEVIERPAREDELFVFELSSYQLEDLDVSPSIAVLTSLFPEHLDHHGSLEAYIEAKRSIIAFQTEADFFACSPDLSLPETWVATTHAQRVPTRLLPFEITNNCLRGEHNLRNTVIAHSVATLLGASPSDVEEVVRDYEGLPHRLQHVGTFNEIEFYDDSISTTPESTIAGIRALKNVDTLILGGVDRGYAFGELESEIRTSGIRNLVLFPESGEHMLSSEEGLTVLHTESMEEAAQFAYAHTEKGKTCLLSPAAPSYNLFKNFEERGMFFSEAVKKYA